MRYLSVLAMVIGLCNIGTSAVFADNTYEFGKMNWLIAKEEVQAMEIAGEMVKGGEKELIYKINLVGREALITHHFNDEGKLVMSVVEFPEAHTDQNKEIDDFYALKDLVSVHFGKPETFIDFQWENGCITDAEEQAHFILLGKLSYSQSWVTDTTHVHLTLDNAGEQVVLRLMMAEREYWKGLGDETKRL